MNKYVLGPKRRALVLGIASFILLFLSPSVYAKWTDITPPNITSGGWGLNSIHMVSSNEGWAVGDREGKGLLLHSSNGSWTNVPPPQVSGTWYLSSVHFTSPSEGWAVGASRDSRYQGVLIHYSNGTWAAINPPDVGLKQWYLSGVHFTSSGEGWAVGVGSDSTTRRGVLLHYSNGSLTSVNPPDVSSNWDLRSVHFTSSNEGWAVGSDWSDSTNSKGVLLHYFNGSWTQLSPPDVALNWELNGIHFISANEGWAVGFGAAFAGQTGVLLHYFNGSWTVVPSPDVGRDYYLNSVHFTSADEGWAVGANGCGTGVLLHYSNGWRVVTPPDVSLNWELSRVYFTSPGEGFAVGMNRIMPCGILAPPPPPVGVILRYSLSSLSLMGGPASFSFKITSAEEDRSGNMKFVTSTDIFNGTLELSTGLSLGEVVLVSNANGCYIAFSSEDGRNLCVKRVVLIAADFLKSQTDQLLIIGTGDFSTWMDGKRFSGIGYLDGKAKLKKDTAGNVTSMSLNGKIAGGIDGTSVFNANFRATVSPME